MNYCDDILTGMFSPVGSAALRATLCRWPQVINRAYRAKKAMIAPMVRNCFMG